ncbi:CoA transferase [Amycolatopsis sp. NPDC006125]|uniref:CoA transferase n=1 Tax=Amycolatopsis sp. NPDC006125 TaxID=3156730 RepID=UPI00339DDF0C
MIGAWIEARTCDEVARVLRPTSVLWSRYRTSAELARDPTLVRHPLFAPLTQPGIGGYLAPGSPLVFDGRQAGPSPAPELGSHTAEVLAELLPSARVEELRARRVIGG